MAVSGGKTDKMRLSRRIVGVEAVPPPAAGIGCSGPARNGPQFGRSALRETWPRNVSTTSLTHFSERGQDARGALGGARGDRPRALERQHEPRAGIRHRRTAVGVLRTEQYQGWPRGPRSSSTKSSTTRTRSARSPRRNRIESRSEIRIFKIIQGMRDRE